MSEPCQDCGGTPDDWMDRCNLYRFGEPQAITAICGGERWRYDSEEGWDLINPKPAPVLRQVIASRGFVDSFAEMFGTTPKAIRSHLKQHGWTVDSGLTSVETRESDRLPS